MNLLPDTNQGAKIILTEINKELICMKKFLSLALAILMVICFVPQNVSADTTDDIIVLYTNDVHCAIDSYDEFAAYRAELIEAGYTVITVDAGDAIQGEVIGALTEGSAIVDLMNLVGYDYAVPGNHEFDYSMDTFLELTEDANYEYLSSNFIDLTTGDTVFEPYDIVEANGEKIAFVGIATPETYTKSTPTYFQNEDGEYIYSFGETQFYDKIQNAIDAAIAEGATRVIAVGHLGITGTTEGWKSTDVIANTEGIDVFIDAHSHEVFEQSVYQNINGDDVILSSTGTKFQYFGQLTLKDDGTETTKLITPESVDTTALSPNAQTAYNTVGAKIDEYNEEMEYLYEVIGTAEVELTLYDPDTEEWVIRTAETNLGDFVADAYRVRTGADVAIINGGGVRMDVASGDVTRKALMDVNPWNNEMCVISATGQQIIDALEHGARLYPEACGGFLHTSGLTYDIEAWKESPVITDAMGGFSEIDQSMERRVTNVKIAGEPIDLEKTYTVAGSYYTLCQGGDGFTMFADATLVKKEGLETDAQMLINYLIEDLDGKITEEQYGNLRGDGRINIYTEEGANPDAGVNNYVLLCSEILLASITICVGLARKNKLNQI